MVHEVSGMLGHINNCEKKYAVVNMSMTRFTKAVLINIDIELTDDDDDDDVMLLSMIQDDFYRPEQSKCIVAHQQMDEQAS